jgi:hypothetical protein
MTQGFNTKPLGSTSSGVKSQPSKTKSSSSVAGVSKTGVTESSPIDYVGTLSPTKSEQSHYAHAARHTSQPSMRWLRAVNS